MIKIPPATSAISRFLLGFGSGFLLGASRLRPGASAAWLGLLLLFGVQHSVMARRPFKQWLTRWIPEPAERSTFVFATCLVLLLLFWQWRARR